MAHAVGHIPHLLVCLPILAYSILHTEAILFHAIPVIMVRRRLLLWLFMLAHTKALTNPGMFTGQNWTSVFFAHSDFSLPVGVIWTCAGTTRHFQILDMLKSGVEMRAFHF